MRQGKISALIHNSSVHPNLNYCSVEIHFIDVIDNPDGSSTPVEDSQLIVSRKAFTNNTSKYTINNKDSTFTEVTTLMRQRGIDLDHKRFLILQGEVESIAQMKPKAENDNDDGLLEYLEDIIGTSSYKQPIQDSQTQHETLNESCLEKTGRLDHVSKELNKLQDDRDKVLQYLKTENELTAKKSALYQLNIHTCVKRIDLSTKVLEEQREKLKQELSKSSSNKNEIESLEEKFKTRSNELTALRKHVQGLSKTLSKQEIVKVQIEEKKKHTDTKQKKLEKAITAANHSRSEAQTWLSNYEQEFLELEERLSSLEASLEVEQTQLASIQEELRDKTQVFADEIEQLQRQLEPWRAKINSKLSEIAVAQSEADMIKEKRASLLSNHQDAKDKVENIMKEGRAKERQIGELNKEQQFVDNQIELGEKELANAKEKLAEMKQQVLVGRQQMSVAKTSIDESQSQGKILASLMKLSKSGRIDGFCGRLGSLGTIDIKYDIAISTACPQLDNFVVETVETGQQCVEYLRKQNLGRAKFILLDRLPQRNLGPIDTPENVPRLFDLLSFSDPKYAQAFYSVMSDTLVAQDAEQARRIAYGKRRWRVVSLQGVLIDKSGTMSGGGKISKGRMTGKQSIMSEQELQQLEDEQQKKEDKYQLGESTFLKMEKALKDLKERNPQIDLELSKVNMEIKSLTEGLDQAKEELKKLT